MKKQVIFLIILSFILTGYTWHLTEQSRVSFSVKHLVFTDVEGRFKDFRGSIDVDGTEYSNLEGFIEVDSIYTGNKDRDKHLLTDDFFGSEKNPEIEFKSNKIFKTGDVYTIIGDLTIKGTTKNVRLYGYETYRKDDRMRLIVVGTIDRFDFKINWNELFAESIIVDKDVHINLKLTFEKGEQYEEFSHYHDGSSVCAVNHHYVLHEG